MEDIAEKEQERMFQQEKEMVEKAEVLKGTDKPASPGSNSPQKENKAKSPDTLKVPDDKEAASFKKGMGKSGPKSPHAKFT